MDHTVPVLPHRAPGHIWVNFWDILCYKPRFFTHPYMHLSPATLRALLLLNPEALQLSPPPEPCSSVAVLLLLNPAGDPAALEGDSGGEGEVPKSLPFSE